MRGYNMTGDTLLVAQAQLNVNGEKGKYPEFADGRSTFDRRIEPVITIADKMPTNI